MIVNPSHSATLRRTENTDLRAMDIVVETVKSSDDDVGRETHQEALHVVQFVDLTSATTMCVQGSHSPSERTTGLSELSMMLLLCAGEQKAVLQVWVVASDGVLEARVAVGGGDRLLVLSLLVIGDAEVLVASRRRFLNRIDVDGLGGEGTWSGELAGFLLLVVVLNDVVVWYTSLSGVGRSLTSEEGRSLPEVGDLEGVVLLDDLAEDVGDEEEPGEDEETESDTEGDGGDEPRWLLIETELWGSLVDDGERADGSGDEEEEW